MKIYISGDPTSRNDDHETIYTEHHYWLPTHPLDKKINISKNDLPKFIENIYYITMEKNGFCYLYPDLVNQTSQCRFEWHYDYEDKKYYFRVGIIFKIKKSKINSLGFFIVPQKNYENIHKEREGTKIDTEEYDKIKIFIENIIDESIDRITSPSETTHNIILYINSVKPFDKLTYISNEILILPSYLVNNKFVSAVIIPSKGYSYISSKRFSEEKGNIVCAIFSLVFNNKFNLIYDNKYPLLTPINIDEPKKHLENIDNYYPSDTSKVDSSHSPFTDTELKKIVWVYDALNIIKDKKEKRKALNMLFSYYAAMQSYSNNKTLSLVALIACMDSIIEIFLPIEKKKNGSRKAIVKHLEMLLGLENDTNLERWSKRQGCSIEFKEG